MNIDPIPLISSFVIGLATGGFYFGGLWLTVRRLPTAERPKRLLAFSYLLRMVALVSVFYFLAQRGLPELGSAMAGLLAARYLWLTTKGRVRPATGG